MNQILSFYFLLLHFRNEGLWETCKYYDSEESGLILRVSAASTRSFAYRYEIGNKKRRMTIGTFPGLSLSNARERVHKLKVQINDGRDPQAKKVAKKSERTIEHKTLKQVIDALYSEKISSIA